MANVNGFGNDVGTITNRVTSMFDKLAEFERGSKEYEVLMYRITCGQLFQQNSIDKIKGIVASPMPKSWYETKSCEDDFEFSLVANKKPIFMNYIYPKEKIEYNNYIKTYMRKTRREFGTELKELLLLENLSEEQEIFLNYYKKNLPSGIGKSTMNRICSYIEQEFKKETMDKVKETFDFSCLKNNTINKRIVGIKTMKKEVVSLFLEYKQKVKDFNSMADITRIEKETSLMYRNLFRREFLIKASDICKDKAILTNIMIEMVYTSQTGKQFVWDCCREQLIENLKTNNNSLKGDK